MLGILVLQEGLATVLSRRDPSAALAVMPGYGPALTAAAEQSLAASTSGAPAERLALEALAREPLDVPALRVLATAWAREGQIDRADAAMTLAGARSLRDTPTHVWLFARRLTQGRDANALPEADGLARRDPDLWPALFPAMTLVLRSPAGTAALVRTLQTRPIWRSAFLASLDASAPTVRSFAVLQALARQGPLNLEETAPYFVRRVKEAPLHQVWLEWVALLPKADLPRLHYLYDGGFSGPRAPPPFDWSFPVQPGAVTQIDARPEAPDNPALLLSFDDGRDTTFTSQVVAVPPGRYRLSLKAEIDQEAEPGRFGFALDCREGEPGRRLGEEIVPDGAAWHDATVEVEVPPDCPAQEIVLFGRPGLGAGRSEMRIDDVALQRLALTQRPSAAPRT